MYYLALNYGQDGWVLKNFETLEEIKKNIKEGYTHGEPFKILKELDFEIKDNNET